MPTCPQPASELVTRARIALGTLVEISLPRSEATPERFAAAFSVVDRIHALMSAHSADSDIARIAREAHRRAVTVDRDTFDVLRMARRLEDLSAGVFDVRVASALLPAQSPAVKPLGGSLVLERECRVRATSPVMLDLGGIAKGYAVDRAVAVLRATGASSGVVNAGGDLRIFGDEFWQYVHVRHPRRPTFAIALGEARQIAVATSGGYYGGTVVDPRNERLLRLKTSVTVASARCAVADALTKIVALAPARAPALLARFRAQAWIVLAHGTKIRVSTAGRVAANRLRPAARTAA